MLQKSVEERPLRKEYKIRWETRCNLFKERLSFASLNIVIFHVKVPSHASKIQTPDIKGGDHGSIDYDSLLKLNIKIARWSHPDANILIFTDYESFEDLPEDEKVTVIRIEAKEDAYVRKSSYDGSLCKFQTYSNIQRFF